MKYLLDTHIFLNILSEPESLSQKVREIIENENSILFLSAVSGWEIIIKYRIGKLKLPENPRDYITNQIEEYNIAILDIKMEHSLYINELPDIHKDPFDRMLIAQSKIEDIPLISMDSKIKDYKIIEVIS